MFAGYNFYDILVGFFISLFRNAKVDHQNDRVLNPANIAGSTIMERVAFLKSPLGEG